MIKIIIAIIIWALLKTLIDRYLGMKRTGPIFGKILDDFVFDPIGYLLAIALALTVFL